MSLQNNIIINTYSVLITLIICFHALKFFEKDSLQDKLYIMMLYITIVMLGIDILGRMDGFAVASYPVLNAVGNFLIFLMNPMIPSLWVTYVHFQIFCDEGKTKRLFYPLGVLNILNVVVLILSQFFGWYYTIDENNVYHRGPFFFIPASITIGLVLLAFIMVVANRRRLERKSFLSLLFFAIPPSISIILQILFYGISLMLNSVVLSLLVVFLNLQSHSVNTDYLTGVYNRKKLDAHLKRKVNSSTGEATFSVIVIDINEFKYINDTYGHAMGDDALETAATLLKGCLRPNDFVARFGGDEFCVVLDVSNKSDLETMVREINNGLERYNESGSGPYKLGFSMGYAVYASHTQKSAEEFLKQVDLLMYENKQANKAQFSTSI